MLIDNTLRKSTANLIKWTVIISLLLVALLNPQLTAQYAESARSLGMANSYMLHASNCEGAAINPANLALEGRKNYSVKLFSFAAYADNNAFTLSDYKKYNGAYLTSTDKEDILAKIPEEGLSIDLSASVAALSFSVGSFAFLAEGIAGSDGNLPKDPIELALMGNKIGEPISAVGTGGDGWSALSFGFAYAREVYRKDNNFIATGLTFKYLYGISYYGIEGLSGEVVTLSTGFNGSGGLTTLEAAGGSGYAVDLGFTATRNGTEFGLVFRNILANINWTKNIKRTDYNFHFDNLTAENASDDTIWVSDEYEIPINKFSSRPPLEIELGTAKYFGTLLISASILQGFENSAFVSKTPRLGTGVEYKPLGWLALRSGTAIGGMEKLALSIGMGLNLGPIKFDSAYSSISRVVPWGGKGGHFAISTIIEF